MELFENRVNQVPNPFALSTLIFSVLITLDDIYFNVCFCF